MGKDARFSAPLKTLVDWDGNILVADSGNARLRRVYPYQNGRTETIGGTNLFEQDGQLAVKVPLNMPYGQLSLDNGDLIVGDHNANRVIRMNAATRAIETIAGTGLAFATVGTLPAREQPFTGPFFIVRDPRTDDLYIGGRNSVVVKYSFANKTLTHFAGTNSWSDYLGDGPNGRPATARGACWTCLGTCCT